MYQESEDTFEILDYTTATDLERFISDFENIIKQWHPCTNVPDTLKESFQIKSQMVDYIQFRNINFMIAFHDSKLTRQRDSSESANPHQPNQEDEDLNRGKKIIERLQDDRNDFAIDTSKHPLHSLYGIDRFVVLQSEDVCNVIVNEDTVKMLLSAVTVAVNNTGYIYPVFVRSSLNERELFQGVFINSAIKFSFEMIQFRSYPGLIGSLLEICDMFKEKISSPRSNPITINGKFTLELNRFDNPFECGWFSKPTSDFNPIQLIQEAEWFRHFVFTPTEEPIDSLFLHLIWQRTRPSILKDSIYFSNYESLVPTKAQLKLNRQTLAMSSFQCALLVMFENLSKTNHELHPLVSFKLKDCTQVDAKSALERITNRESLDISFVELDDGQLNIDQEFRNEMLNFLFASDADLQDDSDQLPLKTCPPNTLSWRFALLIGFLFLRYREWKVISILWRDLTSQLRRFWESCELIPDVERVDSPNFEYGHLHQALQMLNCCIAAKQAKRASGDDEMTVDKFYDCDFSDDNDEEDEFCDAVEDNKQSNQPEGVLRAHETLELLRSNVKLNIPITQEAAPMTEKMLDEQTQLLLKADEKLQHNESSAVRSQLHCALLLSDMEAFKAANPSACFEDFVRWYSPNDYVDGTLSARFAVPDNLWSQLWTNAKSESVAKQKLLFDYTKVAESILHEFDMLSGTALLQYTIPIFCHIYIAKLQRKAKDWQLNYEQQFNDNVCLLQNKLRINDVPALSNTFGSNIRLLESQMFAFESLRQKLKSAATDKDSDVQALLSTAKATAFLRRLAEDELIELFPDQQDGPLFDLFRLLFNASDDSSITPSQLRLPSRKEFYLRSSCPRPSTFSRDLFQMMHCIVSKNEIRLAGCFLEDLVYY